jgi:hypothetical protein
VLGAAAAHRPLEPARADSQAAERLRAHLAFLADDLLEGRFTGSPGYEIAARYVAAQLRQLGLRPAAGGSYLLPVPLVASSIVVDSATLEIVAAGKRERLPWADGFVADGSTVGGQQRGRGAGGLRRLRRRGAGARLGRLRRPRRARQAGAGDARRAGELPARPAAYHAQSERKRAVAAAHGAAGVLTFRDAAEAARSPWQRYAANAGKRPSMDWLEADGTPHNAHPELHVLATLSDTGITALLAAAGGRTLADTAPAALAGGRGFDLGVAVRLAYRSERRRLESSNVAALAARKRLGARRRGGGLERPPRPPRPRRRGRRRRHLQRLLRQRHGLGVAAGDGTRSGDRSAAAAALAALPRRHRRGARAARLAALRHPPAGGARAPRRRRQPRHAALPLPGGRRRRLRRRALVAGSAGSAGSARGRLRALPRPPSPTRSSSCAATSTPSSSAACLPSSWVPGFTSRDPKIDGEAAFRGFLADHYHQPSDEASLPVDWPSAVRFLQANVVLARAIADDEQAPAWKADDFFGKTFGPPPPPTAPPPARHFQR